MQRSATLSAITLTGTIPYTCSYFDLKKRTYISLLETGEVVEGVVKSGIKLVTFNDAMPRINFKWDDENQTHKNIKKEIEFWEGCPIVLLEGVPLNNEGKSHLNQIGKPLLLFVDDMKIKEQQTSYMHKQALIHSKVYNVGRIERENIARYYGILGVAAMDEDELLFKLIDFKGGMLMNPDLIYPATQIPYMDDYLENYKEDTLGVMVKINVQRAIENSLVKIDQALGGAKTYSINGLPIGESEGQVAAYCVKNQDFYQSYIVRALQELDAAAEQDESVAKQKVKSSNKQVTEAMTIRARAKELGIKNWHTKSLAALKTEIEAEEGKKKETITI